MYANNSTIYASGSSIVAFTGNYVLYEGAGIYAYYSRISFHGSSKVTLSSNDVNSGAGTSLFARHSSIAFHGNSTVTFSNSDATYGAAVYSCMVV